MDRMKMENEYPIDVSSAFSSPTFGKNGFFQVDKPVGSMSISPCGRDVVLASRQGLHIIDLDSPWSPPRNLPHVTPWEVADVQWSPFPSRDYWVVSTSNQKALVWNLAMSTSHASIEHILHAHNRAITDINFSAHHPDVLSTCAVDGFVHCWDLRHPARPAISFCDWFAGATQVKWNRQDGHIVASSHDKILRIWDDRNGAYPLRSIEAHDTKIYGVDWNRTKKHGIATCSLDQTIKLWDFSREEAEPERIIRTRFPVWRARHTPFGSGILAMPQRGDNNVYLYDRRMHNGVDDDKFVKPVKCFEGHEDQVKEFLWRPRGNINDGIDNREFQLVTWGSDKTLRLHRLEDQELASVGFYRGTEVDSRLLFTRQNAPYKTFRTDPGKSTASATIGLPTGNRTFLSTEEEIDAYYAGVRPVLFPSSADGGWMGGGFVNTRPNIRQRASARKDLDPIAWMKGVRIGKKEIPFDHSSISGNSPNFKNDTSHEEFESLGEEITHVGSKFSKVEFSHIDISNRRINFSLHGPWGINNSTTYLECRLDFPTNYPVQAAPVMLIEKTASIDAETVARLQNSTRRIGEAFKRCQRSSLEALVHYLQGEQSLEEVMAFTKDDQETSIYDYEDGDNSSSSDGEDDADFPGTQVTDFGMTGSGVLSASNANTNLPVPRTCGANWTYDGRLVCFFLPKQEKASLSLAGSLGLEGPAMLLRKRRRIFEGFGRFHKPYNRSKSKSSSIGTVDSEDTDSEYDSESSDYSSSGSSVSSRGLSSRGQFTEPRPLFRTNIFNFPRAEKSADETQRSVVSSGFVAKDQGGSKNFISIHDVNRILPSKQNLAEEYLIQGPQACMHNAEVARTNGFEDLADAWALLDMLLKEQVPVETVSLNSKAESSIGFRVLKPLNAHDSGTNVSNETLAGSELKAPVKWGQHALGRGYFIKALFSHFTRIADTQMLAMMSCVLFSSTKSRSPTPVELPIATKSPFSHSGMLVSPSGASPSRTDYFPSIEVALSVLEAEQSTKSKLEPSMPRNGTVLVASVASSFGASTSDPVAPLSTGLTPPLSFKSPRKSFDRTDQASQCISGSPERMKWSHRSTSNISSLASSLPRPFAFSASASSSPPNSVAVKRLSPIGSLGTSQSKGNTWLVASTLNRSMSITNENTPTSLAAGSRSRHQNRQSSSTRAGISAVLKNQDQFLNDGYYDAPFLDEKNRPVYKCFRESYADLVWSWGLPMKRVEILKYNHSMQGAIHRGAGTLPDRQTQIPLGNKSTSKRSRSQKSKQLQLENLCVKCDAPAKLSDRSLQTKCVRCHAKGQVQVCQFCHELIRARFSTCIKCGHMLHSRCRDLISNMPDVDRHGCVCGCGCECVRHIQIKVAWPTEYRTAILLSANSVRNNNVEARTWEDVAYESLAKNLGKGIQRNRVRNKV